MEAVATPTSRRLELAEWLVAHWSIVALGSIVAIALAVRVIGVTHNPPGFFTDEAASGIDAQSLLRSAKDTHGHTLPVFFESVGDYKLPVFIYTLVPFVGVLGLSEFTVRFTVGLLGTLTVVTTYLLARELMHRDSIPAWRIEAPALATAAMLAILPWHVHYSRTGFGEMVSFPLVFTLAWWLFLRARRTGASFVPAALAFGVCFYTYRSGWVVLPPFILLLALTYRDDLLARRGDAINAGVLLLACLLPLASHLVFGPDDRAAQAWIFDAQTDKSVPRLFFDQYRSYFTTSFLFEHADNGFILRHYLPGQGVLYWFMAPLLVIGLARVLLWREKAGLLLLALVFIYPLSGALSNLSPISSRAILGSVVFVLLAGVGVQALLDAAAELRPRPMLTASLATAFVLVVAGAVSLGFYMHRYFDEYPVVAEDYWGWQEGAEEIFTRFVALQDQYDEVVMEGFFNAPNVFIPFYTGDACPKCKIGEVKDYEPGLHQLFAFRIESRELQKIDFEIVDALFYRNGRPSFVFVEITGLQDGTELGLGK